MVVAKSVPTPTPPPVVTPDRLEVWVPGKLTNPLNAREHYMAKARRVKREREATAQAVWVALRGQAQTRLQGLERHSAIWRITDPTGPKSITFTVHGPKPFDDDALPAACKAHRDGLQDAGLVAGDAPSDGHTWRYQQVVTRAWAGVQIAVVRA